ncbi:MAG: radical SAM protein [Thermodesulfobacteriota bacterium]
MDIILVKPGNQKHIYGELSAFNLTAYEPPLWACLLAGHLRQKGYSVAVLDAEVEGLSWEQTAQRVADSKPLLAAVMVSGSNPSASTMNMTGAGAIVGHIKDISPGTPTLLGGLHPSALPLRTMEDERCDFVCQGEGFTTLPRLIDALRSGAGDFAIEGLWRREEGRIVPSPMPTLLDDLDSLPMPAWDLVPMEKYRAHTWHCFDDVERRSPYAILYTSLGCPFKCTFCCINALFGKHTIRYRSVESVMAELEVLVERYGVRNIKIIDEMFAMNEKRVVALCEDIAARKWDLNFWAYARVNTVTKPMLEAMKKAGVNWLAYGFESGSKRVIEDVSKGYRMDQVRQVVDMSYELGFHICANFIFGLPEDDYDSMNETLAHMLDINAEWANIYSAMAYPGSQLYDMAVAEGWPLPATWQGFSQYARESLPLPTRHLTGGQVLAFRDYAFNAYYTNPRYLNMIRRTFGEATLRHIQQMTEKRLQRNNTEI